MESQRGSSCGLLIFILIGGGFIAASYYVSPDALTDDGFPLNTFLFWMGVFFAGLPIVLMAMIGLFSSNANAKAEYLAENGIQGEATVINITDTGTRINDNPRIHIDLEIRLEGYDPYQLRKSMVVPLIRLPQVQPGQMVQVLVDPTDRENPNRVGLLLK